MRTKRWGWGLAWVLGWALASGCGGTAGTPFASSTAGSPVGSSSGSAPSSGGCSSSIFSYQPPNDAVDSCWSCVSQGCFTQLSACDADCACTEAVRKAQDCLNRGGGLQTCLTSASSSGSGSTLSAVQTCFASVEGCHCSAKDLTSPLADPAANCRVPTGGHVSSGPSLGECLSDSTMSCNGTIYDVVCTCPQAECACIGPSSKTIPFTACPYCPGLMDPSVGPTGSELFAQCGFPH